MGNSELPNLGDLPGSLATYHRALDVLQPLLDKDTGNLRILLLASEAHQGLGNILESLGRETEAETEDRAGITLADRALRQSPDNADAQYRSLDAHYAFGFLAYTTHPVETESDIREHLPQAIKLAAEHPEMQAAQNKLSEFYSLIGITANRNDRLAESLVYYRKAVEVREAIYRQDPRNTHIQRNLMIGYGHIGDVLGNPFTACLAEYTRALEYYQKAADIVDDMRRADASDKRASFDAGMIWTRIGATRQAAGDAKWSNQALDRAIAEFEALMAGSVGPGNASYSRGVAIAYEYRGRNMWLLGDRQSAVRRGIRSLWRWPKR